MQDVRQPRRRWLQLGGLQLREILAKPPSAVPAESVLASVPCGSLAWTGQGLIACDSELRESFKSLQHLRRQGSGPLLVDDRKRPARLKAGYGRPQESLFGIYSLVPVLITLAG